MLTGSQTEMRENAAFKLQNIPRIVETKNGQEVPSHNEKERISKSDGFEANWNCPEFKILKINVNI